MTEEIKQTVVEETPVVAEPTTGADSARAEPSLEELLAQYEEKTRPQPQPEYTQPEETVHDIRLRAVEQRLYQEDINKTLSNVLGEISIPDTPETRLLALGFVDQMAVKQPAIKAAFDNRVTDPAGWKKFERSLGREFKRHMSSLLVDPVATADREAVAAAVRGASTKVAPEPPVKLGGMSNSEYRKHIREQYGFDPGI